MKEKIYKIIITIGTITILLGFGLVDKISALEITSNVEWKGSNYYNVVNYNQYDIVGTNAIRTINNRSDNNRQELYIEYTTQNTYDYTNIDYISIPFNFTQPLGVTDTQDFSDTLRLTDNNSVYCKEWKQDSNGYYDCKIYQNKITQGTIHDYEQTFKTNELNVFNFYPQIVYKDNTWEQCSVSDNNIICPTPHKEIKQIYIYYFFKASYSTSATITIGTNIDTYSYSNKALENAINNQTENIIGEEHTYNNTPSDTIDRTEMDDYQNAEDNLLNSIDLSGAENIDISINANASNFIWSIVNRLRGISGKIVLLFTSILSIGIIKMVMNR